MSTARFVFFSLPAAYLVARPRLWGADAQAQAERMTGPIKGLARESVEEIKRVQAELDETKARSDDALVQGRGNISLNGFKYGGFVGHENRRPMVASLAADLGRIWRRDPHALLLAYDWRVNFVPRASLQYTATEGRVHLGCTQHELNQVQIVDDLDHETTMAVLAHEAAHCMLPTVCRGDEAGEELAAEFAQAFLEASLSAPTNTESSNRITFTEDRDIYAHVPVYSPLKEATKPVGGSDPYRMRGWR